MLRSVREQAELYREMGMSVIPVDGKRPAVPWKEFQNRIASVDEIHTWFATQVYGLAIITGIISKMVVMDMDSRPKAEAFYRRYRDKIKTIVQSPREDGGFHFYFGHPGVEVRNTQGTKEDFRGDGGIIVAPPTMRDGRFYRCVEGFPIVPPSELHPLPEELIPKKNEEICKCIEEDDTLRRIASARAWLRKAEPAVQGQQGSKKFFFACCRMFQMFNLTMDQAIGPILEYNEKCLPPFSVKEVRHKLEDASKK